ncbi:MAG: hypothetical protein AAF281_17400, partial [Pseudomonadota bacterium]
MSAFFFIGRLPRGGFLINLLLAGAIVVWTVERFLPFLFFEDLIYIPVTELPETVQIAFGLSLWLTLSSAVRRLRDAGSPLPFADLLLGLVVPGLGWLWLFYRLFVAPSRRRRTAAPEAKATGPERPAAAPWGRSKTDASWNPATADASPARGAPPQAEAKVQRSDGGLPTGPTVQRARRVLSA